MKIVVDASVLVAVIANEPEKDALIELTRGAELIVPNSIHWEIGNALSGMLKRRRITLVQTKNALDVYQEIEVRFVEVELAEALSIADELGIYAYDAYVIRCALKYGAPLITLDQALITHARRKNAQVMEVTHDSPSSHETQT